MRRGEERERDIEFKAQRVQERERERRQTNKEFKSSRGGEVRNRGGETNCFLPDPGMTRTRLDGAVSGQTSLNGDVDRVAEGRSSASLRSKGGQGVTRS
jgi:hypothetical protein